MRPVLIQLFLAITAAAYVAAGNYDTAATFWVAALVVWALRPEKR